MMTRCLVIDKVYSILFSLHEWIEELPSVRIDEMFDSRDSAEAFLKTNPVDLVISYSDKDDIPWFKRMRSKIAHLFVIFMVGHEEKIAAKKELPGFCYITKPLDLNHFKAALNQAVDHYRHKEGGLIGNLYVRSEYNLVKIEMEAIEYIESVENHLRFVLNNAKTITTTMTWKGLFQKIPRDSFIRIHRKYVIPVSKIKWVKSKKVKLPGVELPISESYLPTVKNFLGK